MKKVWITHVIATMAFVIFGVLGIASASPPPPPAQQPPATSRNTNRWLSFTIEPSRIHNGVMNPGNTIMWHRLGDGTRMEVFFDLNLPAEDSRFFYIQLMQDFGWRSTGGRWSATGSARHPTRGTMYVNPARRMAIYFFPPGGRYGGYASLRIRFVQ